MEILFHVECYKRTEEFHLLFMQKTISAHRRGI